MLSRAADGEVAVTRIGLYPGTFDPVTNGHMDIIGRAVKLVDRLVIGVAENDAKGPLFTTAERVELLQAEVAAIDADIVVQPFDTLLMHFAEALDANVIVRGLRAVADFEYEFQMTAMNQRLNDRIETVFLMADPRHQAIASRLVKEIARLDGDIDSFVSAAVAARVREKVGVRA
jgi:pantetheine-phosphate adenylyltransferase